MMKLTVASDPFVSFRHLQEAMQPFWEYILKSWLLIITNEPFHINAF